MINKKKRIPLPAKVVRNIANAFMGAILASLGMFWIFKLYRIPFFGLNSSW
jgi:hypothetical protein